MAKVLVVGDGPGGLAAAIFLAKAGQSVVVFGDDATAMQYAYLRNYPGTPDMPGPEWQQVVRKQAADAGASFVAERIARTEMVGGRPVATTVNGDRIEGDYLILTEGKDAELARSMGLASADAGIPVNSEFRSAVDRVYVVGRSARPKRSQAVISAGAGATAALDILSLELGREYHDWDSPPEEDGG